jgi:hypothetical protein
MLQISERNLFFLKIECSESSFPKIRECQYNLPNFQLYLDATSSFFIYRNHFVKA